MSFLSPILSFATGGISGLLGGGLIGTVLGLGQSGGQQQQQQQSAPPPPPPPPPPPAPATMASASVAKSGAAQRAAAAAAGTLSGTIRTSPQGDTSDNTTGGKNLLGGTS